MSTLVVTNLNDDNSAGSLRSQIAASASGDTITFNPSLRGGTLVLAQGALAVTHSLTIEGDVNGNGTPDITIDGGGASRLFNIDDGAISIISATLDGLVLTHGAVGSGLSGGGIAVGLDHLTISNSVVTANTAAAYGGGIWGADGSSITVIATTVSDNQSSISGGVGAHNNASITLINSTVAGNYASVNGGGVYGGSGSHLSLTNTTVSGNSAHRGGGIYSQTYINFGYGGGNAVTLNNSTVNGNYAFIGGGIDTNGGPLQLNNSIVAGNGAAIGTTEDLVGGASTDLFLNHSIIGTTPNSFNSVTGSGSSTVFHGMNQTDLETVFASVGNDPHTNVLSGLLADNGGPVHTVAINPTGIARDAGDDAAAVYDDDNNPATPDVVIPTDARGAERVAGAHVDVGAFEFQVTPAALVVTTLADELDSSDPNATFADLSGGTGLSLREALALAKQDPTITHTITFDPSLVGGSTPGVDDGHLTLTNGELVIASSVSIEGDVDGNGTPDITIDANHAASTRVFDVGAVTATLDGLVITGGNSLYGAGIVTAAGTYLTVSNSTIADNHGGGAIRNVGTLTLDHVTVSGNTSDSDGGGIANALSGATLHVIDSTIANNTAAFNGGGLVNSGGNSASLTNVTMVGNSAHGTIGGGAIYSGGDLTLTQVTITGNHADTNGGGVYTGAGHAPTITNSILAGNDAGGVQDDLLALTPANYAGVNVVGTGSDTDASDHVIQTPTLGDLFAGALANNGGGVQTVAINPTGVAHDAGSDAAAFYDDDNNPATPDVAIPTDARDFGRIAGAHVDIGAFEQQADQSFVVTTLDDQLEFDRPACDACRHGRSIIAARGAVPCQRGPHDRRHHHIRPEFSPAAPCTSAWASWWSPAT